MQGNLASLKTVPDSSHSCFTLSPGSQQRQCLEERGTFLDVPMTGVLLAYGS